MKLILLLMKALQVNMKYISFFIILFLFGCNKREREIMPPYNVIARFSERLEQENGVILCSYGINLNIPKDYEIKNGVADVDVSFYVNKKKSDCVTLKDARKLLIYIVDGFLNEINSDEKAGPLLDSYPMTNDSLVIAIHFHDENRVNLGQGIAQIYFARGKIKYESYNIREYRTSRLPAKGDYILQHQETYAEALELVKREGEVAFPW